MLKIIFSCVFLTYLIQSSVAAPLKVDLVTASPAEVFSLFPNAADITKEKLTAEQADAVNHFAKEKDINIEETLVFLRIFSNGMQNEAEGKPGDTGITQESICSDLNAAPSSPDPANNKTSSEQRDFIKRLRMKCQTPNPH